jgi:hypothetical protein
MPLNLFGIQISRWSQSAESAFAKGMELVRTDCLDEEIRDAIRDVADGKRSAIEEALRHVEDMRREPQSYVTDRALRVFAAAAENGPVAPVDCAHAELYEREMRLEKLPRHVAIAELCELSPAVRRYCANILLKRNHYEKAGWIRIMLIERNMEKEVDALVGPASRASEPLLRSPIVNGIVMSWIRDTTGLAKAMKRSMRNAAYANVL